MSTNKYLKDYLNGDSDDFASSFESFHNESRTRQKVRTSDPSDRKETRQPKSRTRRIKQKDD